MHVNGGDLIALFRRRLPHAYVLLLRRRSAYPAQLIFTEAPLTIMVPLASTFMVLPAFSLLACDEQISTFCASSLIGPLEADNVMSLSDVIVMEFLEVSITMLFFWLLSMISMVSFPSSSLSFTTCPLRDLIMRTSFLPSSLVTGGASLPFHSAPNT